jgi:phosphoserine phosphatase RsbU/P
MTLVFLISLLLALLAGAGLFVAGRLARQRGLVLNVLQTEQQRIQAEREAIVVEERRLFRFLHELGVANSRGARDTSLHRFIVEGIVKVTNSAGGALYIYDEVSKELVPRHYSEHCAPLLNLSSEALAQAVANPSAMLNTMRLQTVADGDGIIGHAFASQLAEPCSDMASHPLLRSEENKHQRGITLLVGPVTSGDRKLGVLAVTAKSSLRNYTTNDLEVFASLIEQAAFALGHAMTHQELQSKRILEAELKTAGDVQRILLPDEDPTLKDFVVAGRNRPARVLSGDFYDYMQPQPGAFAAVIADVSGKGLPAALVAATCRSALQAHALNLTSPAAVLSLVNRQIYEDIREDMFVSMIYLVIDAGGDSITLARAGHPEPLLWRAASGEIETVRSSGLGVGIDKGDVFDRVTKDHTVRLASGDCLLLYTDGVNEAEDADGEEFGEERIKQILAAEAKRGAAAVIERIMDEVNTFVGGKASGDDITLIVLQKK